jgi:hypothetical protein
MFFLGIGIRLLFSSLLKFCGILLNIRILCFYLCGTILSLIFKAIILFILFICYLRVCLLDVHHILNSNS